MRPKEIILEELRNAKLETPVPDTIASLHARITIEALLDIRDNLSSLVTILGSFESVAYLAG